MCKNLVRTQLTRTTSAIDWSQVMCENGDSPEKFSGKNEAIRHARCRRIVYDSIEQVQFRYETAWAIFKDDKFLNGEGTFSQFKDYHSCYRQTTLYPDRTQTDNYYWYKEAAINRIPHDHPNAVSMSVYDNIGNLVFGRKFANLVSLETFMLAINFPT